MAVGSPSKYGASGGRAGRNAGQGYSQFGALNAQLQQAVVSFSQLVTGATLFGQTIGTFREFEKQLTMANSAAGGTIEQFQQMERATRQFALATAASATEAASAMFFLSTAGFKVEESLSAMNAVLTLSQATLTDVAFTTDVIASNLRAFGLEATDATRMSNVFSASITNSLSSMDKLAFSLRQVAPAAAAMGADLEQVVAQLSELYNIGLRGEQAGTQLRNVYVRLARPVGAAQEILRKFSIQTTEANGELRDLRDILIDIGEANLSTAQLSQVFGVEGVAGGVALIKSAMTGALDEMQDNITGTNRTFELFVKNLHTFDGAAKVARNAMNEMFIAIGESAAGPLRDLGFQFRDLVVWFRELDESTRELIIKTTAITALFFTFAAALKSVGALVMIYLSGGLRVVTMLGRWAIAMGTVSTSMTALRASMAGTLALNFAGMLQRIGIAAAAAIPPLNNLIRSIALTRGAQAAMAAAGLAGLGAVGIAIVGAGGLIYAIHKLTEKWRENRATSKQALKETYDDLVKINDLVDLSNSNKRMEATAFALQAAENLYSTDTGKGIEWAAAALGEYQKSLQTEREKLEEELTKIQHLWQEKAWNIVPPKELAQAIEEAEAKQLEIYSRLQKVQRQSRIGISKWLFGQDETIEDDPKELRRQLNAVYAQLANLRAQEAAQKEALAASESLRNDTGAMEQRLTEVREQMESVGEVAEEALRQMDEAYSKTFNDILQGKDDISKFVRSESEESFLEYIRVNQGAIVDGILAAIKAGETDIPTNMSELFDWLRNSSFVPQEIKDALIERSERDRVELTLLLDEVNAKARDTGRDIAARLAQSQATLSGELADEIGAIKISSDNRLISETRKMLESHAKGIEDAFGEVTQFGVRLEDAAQEALETLGVSSENAGMTLGEAMSLTGFAKGIEETIDSGASPEEVEAWAEQKKQEYLDLIDAILQQMLDAGQIADETAAIIRETMALATDNVIGAVQGAVADVAAQTHVATTRHDRRSSRGGGGRKGRDPAEEARRARRAFENAMREIDAMRLAAKRAQLDYGIFDIQTRISMTVELDIEDIKNRYDAELSKLHREIEDLNEKYKDQPLELDKLSAAYRVLISEVEAARDAEIAYTQSFTAQVERRNAAIDTQINQIRNLAMEAGNGIHSVKAGLSMGLLEYMKDVRTTVDNVADLTMDALGSLSDALGKWVTGQGDFLELLRSTLLNAVTDFATNEIKRVMQELAGSMMGAFDAMTGSASGSSQGMSGAGGGIGGGSLGAGMSMAKKFMGGFQSGGIMGGVMGMLGLGGGGFGGIGGAGGISVGQASAPQVGGPFQEHINIISDAINQFTQGMAEIFNQFLQSLTEMLNQFGEQFSAALQSAVSAAGGGDMAGFGSIAGFAGFFDKGGRLGKNQWGIVGERRPEIVTGPAGIIGGDDTARLLGGMAQPQEPPVINNIIVQDESVVARYLSSSEGRRQINNIINQRRSR